MDAKEAVILGVLRGISESMPISATAHFVFFDTFFTIDPVSVLATTALINFGIAIVFLYYFSSDLWIVTQAMLRKLSRLPVNSRDLTLGTTLLVGSLPAILLYLIVEPHLQDQSVSPGLVGLLLFIASIFLMYAEWRYFDRGEHDTLTVKRGLGVGIYQVLGLLPGWPRLGAVIGGGMVQGLTRLEATRLAFMLSIPFLVVLGARDAITLLKTSAAVVWTPVIIATLMAMITTLVGVKFVLHYVSRYSLWPFIWYGMILATLLTYIHFFTQT